MKLPFLPLFLLTFTGLAQAPENTYLDAAQMAGEWLKSHAVATELGTVWPQWPDGEKRVSSNLYSGTPGVVLFFLEHFKATQLESSKKMAIEGADYLLTLLKREESRRSAGLYTGLAGVGFVLSEVYKVSGEERHLKGLRQVVGYLQASARESGAGVEWSEVTDIIGGTAGTGLFLLYAADELKQPKLKQLAAAAGRRLIEQARPEGNGLKWAMSESFSRLMPNFSHGTAGIAYFLLRLHQETGDEAFLDAAVSGARYLQGIARHIGDGCLIFHHEPEGEDLFYLSWCHGPAGTARLFLLLNKVTGKAEWMDWVRKLARGVMDSGIPEKETPGYWNNVSRCCGAAGIAEFFANLYRATGEDSYLAFARRAADAMLGKATSEKGSLKWIQAEHRVRPKLLQAQTGYMQGAAGIGIALLHLDSLLKGRPDGIELPDSPYGQFVR